MHIPVQRLFSAVESVPNVSDLVYSTLRFHALGGSSHLARKHWVENVYFSTHVECIIHGVEESHGQKLYSE